ncbi:hypothetical protein QAD02_001447 [Eretmocerus hayati]|uniref:Uncharacterized protein n=1 Tax=Eretmocerus hayati TaxID=131215 RepID=A0ACC2NHA4_9HYME|nr:hypothetical protein QAD02_001447 [Eretmocerus hayati]
MKAWVREKVMKLSLSELNRNSVDETCEVLLNILEKYVYKMDLDPKSVENEGSWLSRENTLLIIESYHATGEPQVLRKYKLPKLFRLLLKYALPTKIISDTTRHFRMPVWALFENENKVLEFDFVNPALTLKYTGSDSMCTPLSILSEYTIPKTNGTTCLKSLSH